MSCFSARDCPGLRPGDGENFSKSCVRSTRHNPGLEHGEKADHLPQGFFKRGCNSASSISPTWELVRNANSSPQHRPAASEGLGVDQPWVATSLSGGSDAGCTEVPKNSLTQTHIYLARELRQGHLSAPHLTLAPNAEYLLFSKAPSKKKGRSFPIKF